MREAFFAFAGTALGVLGTLVTDVHWGRGYDDDDARRAAMRDAHDEARSQYERLRLITSSLRVQEEARYALRYAYGLLRQLDGHPPREDEVEPSALDQIEDRVVRLFTEVRRELGVPGSHHVLSERTFFEQISSAAAID
ncbi:hypothetical protein ACWET9_45600 [Streptomyces sp. NPDC004059]